jgi:hypothetical protein
MSVIDKMAEGLAKNGEFLKMHLADFSDADMLARPCPGANHAAWQLGHLIAAETNLANAFRAGVMPELPAGFSEKFDGKEASKRDDPKSFPSKAELISLFERTRAASVKFTKSLKEQELGQPMPEKFQSFVPTVGDLIAFTPVHSAMHIGQFQVIRRKLGKPVLF